MKTPLLFCLLGLLGSIPWVVRAEIKPPESVLGKFLVSSVNGTATCISDGRIIELKKGDAILARGAKISIGPKSDAILVLSNGTGVFADENTQLEVDRFEQEPFTPGNNLRLEPSNSVTAARLIKGRILLSTPRLLSRTSMIYQTPHASISVRGDKLLIEADDTASHIAMIEGNATISPRDAAGNFLSRGERLASGQEAFVRFNVLGPAASERNLPAANATDRSAGANSDTLTDGSTFVRVLKLTGPAEAQLPPPDEVTRLMEGTAIPAGSVVSTGDETLLYLQPFSGAITAVLPHSVVAVEQLSITGSPATAHRASTFALQAGSMISILDPARRESTDYAVRTMHGIATAHGTLFFASVQKGGLVLATAADSVSFASSSGETFQVGAGHAVLAQPGQKAQPPIPLVQALEQNSQVSEAVQQAFTALASAVGDNIGGLTPAASIQLLSQTAATSASALPEQAETFAADAAAAIALPTSSFADERTPALAAVLKAIVSGLPDRATPTATAVARSSLPQAAVIASAATAGAPAHAVQVASSVARLVLPPAASAAVAPADLQTLAAITASVTHAAPKQANAVAVAVMQAVLDASRNPTPTLNAQHGALIAAAATRAAPDQAVAIARTMMQLLAQHLQDATPAVVGQTGALLAGAIISVVPDQAQPVATAVMLLTLEAHPHATPEWTMEVAGILASTLTQLFPASANEIYTGIADAIGRSLTELEALAAQYKKLALELGFAVSQIVQSSSAAFAEGAAAHQALLDGLELARPPGGSSGIPPSGGTSIQINNSTSVIITEFDPARIAEFILDLDAALAAQTTVQFYTEPDGNGATTVQPWPTVPRTLPADLLVSPSALPR